MWIVPIKEKNQPWNTRWNSNTGDKEYYDSDTCTMMNSSPHRASSSVLYLAGDPTEASLASVERAVISFLASRRFNLQHEGMEIHWTQKSQAKR